MTTDSKLTPVAVAPPGKKRRPFDVSNLLLGRGLAVVIAGTVLFLALAPLAFLKREPFYHTGGSVLVSPKVRQVLSREERIIHGSFHDFAETQANRMLTTEVLSNALDSIPRAQWPSFIDADSSMSEATALLRPRLKASPVARSYLLFVGLTGTEPEGLAETVNAVMQAYITKLETEQEGQSRRRLEYLKSERALILSEIEANKRLQAVLATELKSRTFNELNNAYFESILVLQQEYVLAKTRELTNASEVDRAAREATLLNKIDLNVLADESVARNEAVYLIEDWTYQKLQELRGTIDGLTPENPDRVYVESRMSAMNDYLEEFKVQLHGDFHRILNEKRSLELSETAAKAEAAHGASVELTSQIEEALEAATNTYQRSTELIAEGKELDADIRMLRNRFTMVDESIREVYLDAKAPTHVSIEDAAVVPRGSASDNLTKYLAILFVAAFGLAGTCAVTMELVDSRVRGWRDLQHALGVAPPDPVADFPESESDADSDWCVYRDPSHPAAAAIRKLAVRLTRERDQHGARVFLFSDASCGAGSLFIGRNTAAAFTQYLSRVLYVRIAGDLSRLPTRPRTRDDEQTSSQLVEAGLQRIDCSSRLASLELSGTDPLLQNRADFMSLLHRAGEGFDAIVVDSEPLLESDLTQYLVHQVDANIVVARHRETSYAELRRSIELLYQSSTPAMTAVLAGAATSPLEKLIAWRDRLVGQVSSNGLSGLWKAITSAESLGAGVAIPSPESAKVSGS